MKLSKAEEYSISIFDSIASLVDKDSNNYKFNPKEINGTDFFTGITIAYAMLYDRLTGNDSDLIDIIDVQNRLVMQHLIEHSKEDN